MDNHTLETMSMFFIALARRYAEKTQPGYGERLYMAARIDGIIPLSFPWPFFYSFPGLAREHARLRYPQANHIVEINLENPCQNPRAMWEEI